MSTTKKDLVAKVAETAEITKKSAALAVDAIFDAIAADLAKGDAVAIAGFGTFSVKARAARTGKNPKTGAKIEIAATKTPGFKAGKALKEAVK